MVNFCCQDMKNHIEYQCETHKNPFDCPDKQIYYNEIFDEYGMIIHDGGSSYNVIDYCPFCGKKLPCPKREIYFHILNTGYGKTFEQIINHEIPEEFKSDDWWKNRHFDNLKVLEEELEKYTP